MFLRKLGKRGVAMTEYAVLLAFVAAIGGSFASDNGLGQSIINAITGAKNAITDAGTNKAKVNRAPVMDQDAEQFQGIMTSIVDGIYEAYLDKDIKINSFRIDANGQIKDIKYWDENGNTKSLAADKYLENKNYSSILDGSGYTFAKHGGEETYLYYNQEGKLVMPDTTNSVTGNAWPKVVLKDTSNDKDIWIAGKGLDANGSVIETSNKDSYMYVHNY
ncbi:MAG: hypothetical protein SOV56_05015 [Phascolarctobacterium sp.]|nr:hypothetical protein [Phascolarctobacterium sp.]